MADIYDDKIWLKHKDEEDIAYSFFASYYLNEKDHALRTATTAYKKYLKEAKGHSDTYIAGISTVPPKYSNWSKGLSSYGVPTVDKTWEERANAYWLFLAQDEMNLVMDRRKNIIESEYNQGTQMLDVWQLLFMHFLRYMNDEVAAAKKRKEVFDTSTLFRKFRDILNTRDDLSSFLRRSVGLTDVIKEDLYAKQVDEKKIEIEWTLPETKKYVETEEDKELSILSQEDFAALVERLSLK